MKDNQFRSGFLAAVFLFISIAVIGMSVKSIFPSTGEAFVLESVPEYPTVISDSSIPTEPVYSEEQSVTVQQTQSAPIEVSEPVAEPPVVSSVTESTQQSLAAPEPTNSNSVTQSSVSPVTPQSSTVPQSTQQAQVSTRIPAAQTPSESVGIININTASSRELQKLNGIGEVKAQAIIDYRNQNGGFSSVDELINVKGIGEKTLEKIRENVTV